MIYGCLCVQTCVSLHLCFLCFFLGGAALSSVCFVSFQFVFILSYYSLDARRGRQKGCVWIWMGGQVERNWKELWKRKLIRIYGILKSVFNKRKFFYFSKLLVFCCYFTIITIKYFSCSNSIFKHSFLLGIEAEKS